jgi:hypothetical protein
MKIERIQTPYHPVMKELAIVETLYYINIIDVRSTNQEI